LSPPRYPRAAAAARRKLTDEQVAAARSRIDAGEPLGPILQELGVSRMTLYRAVGPRGRRPA
jgi:hypothetical protein